MILNKRSIASIYKFQQIKIDILKHHFQTQNHKSCIYSKHNPICDYPQKNACSGRFSRVNDDHCSSILCPNNGLWKIVANFSELSELSFAKNKLQCERKFATIGRNRDFSDAAFGISLSLRNRFDFIKMSETIPSVTRVIQTSNYRFYLYPNVKIGCSFEMSWP